MSSTNKSYSIEKNELTLWEDGIERGKNMAEFVNSDVIDLKDSTVLDLGCGMGGISLAFAQRSKKVVSGDFDVSRLLKVKKRVQNNKVQNMFTLKFHGRTLPFRSETFDLVIMNGVFEYMGVNNVQLNPKELQMKALKEAKRVLKKNGKLYIAIENRWYPAYFFKDVHCGLPLVAMLPRKFANFVSLILSKNPFQTYIYSYWELKRMLGKAEFIATSFFVPFFNYQYPILIKSISNRHEILQYLDHVYNLEISSRYKKMSFGNTPSRKVALFRILTRMGLLKLFTPCFVIIASK